ncbi:uncharacterized protein TRIADDRAFT_20443 [Trichoplax adhaerens]|uniref:Syntaxin-binding protein 1 n=1 Tax=Trichoplax adhaerens TaxID=10228 RepID=B3RPC7_TRIAD|nr:hypothetical protein TRIADDRAFT_20443 [Trichoplax adhaerens]EDV28165.1 hypothetical protein TRIADDRAFT_20443 [Trichoplax adhaerens]|eukprot:XP_002109999.1 hypothetical protein TRIADDRAFT_20443 [Trichoplax adhaerens]
MILGIIEDVLRPLKKPREWKVLIVDHLGTRILSACCKMHELVNEGITVVENLSRVRQPLSKMESIYLITPTEESIDKIIADFSESSKPHYKCAHVFYTEACPDELFQKFSKSPAAKYVKTLKEINISFLPIESQVFSLDYPDILPNFYGSIAQSRTKCMERMAEQLATLCATLGEYPIVRYNRDHESVAEFTQMFQGKLDAYKADDPSMGDTPEKLKSQLVILDRGFDPVSPILHECYFQAMAYDLLPIENDVYRYATNSGPAQTEMEKKALLDESNELWVKLRHEHIAVVSQNVTTELKKFADTKRMAGKDRASMRDLSQMLKKMPQYQKELSRYSLYLHLAEDCMKRFKEKIDKLVRVEQDLATGTDADGERVKDPMKNIVPIMLDQDVSPLDKIRVILLLTFAKNGQSEENREKLIKHANIPTVDREIITKMSRLGVKIDDKDRSRRSKIERRDRSGQVTYQSSRWIPLITDVMQDAIDDKLDTKAFPFISGQQSTGVGIARPKKYGWGKDKSAENRTGPRLIIFVIGGMSYSEMRAAYEVSKAKKDWEVIIGSTHLLTPELFLNSLRNLDSNE